ncbi:MAG: SPOR domain-containing protein [Bacilli bacterium]|nr:SPOR domain-containing protein [Bacilli bacterium]
MNKKFLIYVLSAILLGAIFGSLFYKQYEKEKNIAVDYNTYLLQLGIYNSRDEFSKEVEELSDYLVVEKNNKFYVYVGISTKRKNAEKLQNLFSDNDINVSIKKSVIDDIEFISNLQQYDLLLDSASNKDDIMSINEVILSSYEEMVLVE